jgi:hypothetical protein
MSLSTIEQQIVTEYGIIIGTIKNYAVPLVAGEFVMIVLLALKII